MVEKLFPLLRVGAGDMVHEILVQFRFDCPHWLGTTQRGDGLFRTLR